jgi:hypothetical protein
MQQWVKVISLSHIRADVHVFAQLRPASPGGDISRGIQAVVTGVLKATAVVKMTAIAG